MNQAMPEMLLKHNLKTLRLPTMLAEYAKLSREAADADEGGLPRATMTKRMNRK